MSKPLTWPISTYLYFGILVWKPQQTPCPILVRGVVLGLHQQMLQASYEVCAAWRFLWCYQCKGLYRIVFAVLVSARGVCVSSQM